MQRNPAQYAEQRAAVWEHRVRGVSVADISASMNIPQGTVYRWLKEIGEARVEQSARELLTTELARIDHWQSQLELQLEEQIEKGRNAARTVEVLSKLSERRARLLGMDKPQQVEATVHQVDDTDVAIAELVRNAEAAAALEEQRIREVQS